MSERKPTVTVTRGAKKAVRGEREGDEMQLPGVWDLASGMVRGVRNAWLAGLGILSVAQDASTQVFNALVEEGRSWEQRQAKRRDATARRVRTLREEGSRTVDAMEARMREEVGDALQRIGVPRRADIDELRAEVDVLVQKVERLSRSVEREKGRGEAS